MLKLNIAGDFVLAPTFLDQIKGSEIVDSDLQKVFTQADINIDNLEAPIVDKLTPSEKYGPSLHTDARCLEILKNLNINLVTLANNHILDHSAEGLKSTIKYLTRNNIDFVGAGKDLSEASRPCIMNKKNLKIGILNFAENEFSNTDGNYPGASPLNIIDNTIQIQSLKSEVDKVIVIIHGGAELHKYPSPRFKKLLEFFANQGADAVIAHHTHVYNGSQVINNTPIVYGTGNFIFPKKNADISWNLGVICQLEIEKNQPIRLKEIPVILDVSNEIKLKSLNETETKHFLEIKKKLTKVIASEKLVKEEYQKFVDKVEKQYVHYLQPYTSKYLHKLLSLGLLPNFLNNKVKKKLYLNIIRCEAHRDILLNLLSK